MGKARDDHGHATYAGPIDGDSPETTLIDKLSGPFRQ
jgi:hypothetical protein